MSVNALATWLQDGRGPDRLSAIADLVTYERKHSADGVAWDDH